MLHHNNQKIFFFGASGFPISEYALDALLEHGYAMSALVSKPGERIIREEKNIQIFQPEKLDTAFHEQILELEPDIYIVAAYGKIIPKVILEIPPLGVLNVHPSFLPRWRGPSPGQFAILHGDTETGVSIMKMDEHMDHGPILANKKLQITNDKITTPELYDALGKMGADLLIETLPKWIQGEITPIVQDDTKATYSKILKKDDGRITWTHPAEEIERMIRAFTPWPSAWTLWPSEKIYRIRIDEAGVYENEMPQGVAGFAWQDATHPLLIKTGARTLEIKRLTIEGKKTMDSASFIRGYAEIIGATLV